MESADSTEYSHVQEQTQSNRRLYILMLIIFGGTIATAIVAGLVYKQNEKLEKELDHAKKYYSSFLVTLGDLRKKVDDLTTNVHRGRDQISTDIHECLDCPIDDGTCPCFDTLSLRYTNNCSYVAGGNGGYTWAAHESNGNNAYDLFLDDFGVHHCTNISGNYLTMSTKAGEDCLNKLVASCPKPSCSGRHDDPTCACDNTLTVPREAMSCFIYGKDVGEWVTKVDFGIIGKACANAINSEDCASPPYGCLFENEAEESLLSRNNKTCYETLCSAHQIYDTCIMQHG